MLSDDNRKNRFVLYLQNLDAIINDLKENKEIPNRENILKAFEKVGIKTEKAAEIIKGEGQDLKNNLLKLKNALSKLKNKLTLLKAKLETLKTVFKKAEA